MGIGILDRIRKRFGRKRPMPALVKSVDEQPAPEGATCQNPRREAVEEAFAKLGPGQGVDFRTLPKCGAPAKTRVTTVFENAPTMVMDFCAEHRPKGIDEIEPKG